MVNRDNLGTSTIAGLAKIYPGHKRCP